MLQESDDRYLDDDAVYPDYDSGPEGVNASIEPYPGDLRKIIDFDMKTRRDLGRPESDIAKVSSGEGTAQETPPDKDNKKMNFEAKMMRMTKDMPPVGASEKGQVIAEKTQLHTNQNTTRAEPNKSESQSQSVTKPESSNGEPVTISHPNTSSIDTSKKLNFEAKLKQAQLSQSAQPTQAQQVNSVVLTTSPGQSEPSPATQNKPAEQVNRQSSFEGKMRQMTGILKLPPLPTSLPTSLPIKLPNLGLLTKSQPSSQPATGTPTKGTQQPPQKVTPADQARPKVSTEDPTKKAAFEDKMKMMNKPDVEVIVMIP
ncbi:hypothetical protein Pmani_029512 [Petrolisthes manimaculis]|uniref:Uncharacterized protein n=1 Tax=Petrolisthes manimaculis TaxID=1843537 RepID=A0AAE1TWX6_9EUCA|nr:hypothetical protein Pmani_029512 [Petrolisthes manimaculis]